MSWYRNLRARCSITRRTLLDFSLPPERLSDCPYAGQRSCSGVIRKRILLETERRNSEVRAAYSLTVPRMSILPICHNLPMCGRYKLSQRKQVVEEHFTASRRTILARMR